MKNPKSLITNLLALILLVVGYFSPWYRDQIFATGVFALSGALTNWLAIYMLFEKVPGLYGSGVVPNRFEEFKAGIRALVMGQFFTQENLDRFFADAAHDHALDPKAVTGIMDHDKIFNKLLEAIIESQFGSMLGMFGGAAALEPLRGPFRTKIDESIEEIISSPEAQNLLIQGAGMNSEMMIQKIENVVNQRLDELTPKMVKEIVQEMIEQHLGWLVVWGGVFGGLIGFVTSFFW